MVCAISLREFALPLPRQPCQIWWGLAFSALAIVQVRSTLAQPLLAMEAKKKDRKKLKNIIKKCSRRCQVAPRRISGVHISNFRPKLVGWTQFLPIWKYLGMNWYHYNRFITFFILFPSSYKWYLKKLLFNKLDLEYVRYANVKLTTRKSNNQTNSNLIIF